MKLKMIPKDNEEQTEIVLFPFVKTSETYWQQLVKKYTPKLSKAVNLLLHALL